MVLGLANYSDSLSSQIQFPLERRGVCRYIVVSESTPQARRSQMRWQTISSIRALLRESVGTSAVPPEEFACDAFVERAFVSFRKLRCVDDFWIEKSLRPQTFGLVDRCFIISQSEWQWLQLGSCTIRQQQLIMVSF